MYLLFVEETSIPRIYTVHERKVTNVIFLYANISWTLPSDTLQEDRSGHFQRPSAEFQSYDSLRYERWPKGQSGSVLSISVRRSRDCRLSSTSKTFETLSFVREAVRAARHFTFERVPFLVSAGTGVIKRRLSSVTRVIAGTRRFIG